MSLLSSARGETYDFRNIHPNLRMGTASDRYAGWLGQVYTPERYAGRITSRSRKLGKKSFVEEILPVDSVSEYFEHFNVLELDFTFYRPVRDPAGKPTHTENLLREYRKHLKDGGRLILKAPQSIFAQKLRGRGGAFWENPRYLDSEAFMRGFWEPATAVLGDLLHGVVFEQEYQRARDRISPEVLAEQLDRFFESIPSDSRYHVELRTDAYLTSAVFDALQRHGVGQVLSHWTWLPSLRSQFGKAGEKVMNRGLELVVRLMTPRNMRYEDAYAMAHPFDRLVEEMAHPAMTAETVWLIEEAIARGFHINVIINNRAGGNAPMMARMIEEALRESRHTHSK